MLNQKVIFVLMLLSLLIFCYGCSEKKNSLPASGNNRGMKVPVEVVIVKPQLLIDELFVSGTILPNEKVELRNEMAGRINGLFFEEGTVIPKGKLLLKINDSDLQAQLKKAKAQETLIGQEEFRKKKLLEINAISNQEYDMVLNQLETIRAEIDLIRAQISKTEIYAPFTGKVGLRHVSPGSYLSANSLIASLQQTDTVKIEFSLPEKYAGVITRGMDIGFSKENQDTLFRGKIYAIEPSVNTSTRTVTVRAISPNQNDEIIPGGFTKIRFILNRIPDALLVPSEAVSTEIGGNFLYIYKMGRAHSVKVKTGIRTPNDIQISEGLLPGDSLIITGLLQINHGTPVEPEIVPLRLQTNYEKQGEER